MHNVNQDNAVTNIATIQMEKNLNQVALQPKVPIK